MEKKLILKNVDCRMTNLSFTNELLTRKEVANYFKVSTTTIYLWGRKNILNPLRCGRRVYYKRSEIEQAVRSIYNLNISE